MILLFALLIIVASFGLVAAWLGANPGSVTMLWFGYQVEMSVSVLLMTVLLITITITCIYTLLRKLLLAPSHYAQRRSVKQYQRALTEITHSVAALAASDMGSAVKHTKKAERALGTTPLTLLLRAQISKSEGNDDTTRVLLEQLLEHPETEYLAAKSLADVAQKQHRLPQAMALAKRAHAVNPRETHGALSVLDIYISDGKYQEAEAHAQHARKTGAFTRADLAAAHGKIALKQAEDSLAGGQIKNALTFAQRAVKYMPGDVQAAELCAKLYVENSEPQKALGVIQSQWKTKPSMPLADLFNEITLAESPAKKQKLTEKIIASNQAAPENLELSR
jgi:HemY protein